MEWAFFRVNYARSDGFKLLKKYLDKNVHWIENVQRKSKENSKKIQRKFDEIENQLNDEQLIKISHSPGAGEFGSVNERFNEMRSTRFVAILSA